MADIRAFFALPVSTRAEQALSALIDNLQDRPDLTDPGSVRWVPPVNYHLTLAFLGNIKLGKLPLLNQIASSVVADFSLPPVNLSLLDWFPSAVKPRAIVAVPQPCPALNELQKKLVASLRQHGIHCQGKAFRPHITLSRVKNLQAPMDLHTLPFDIANHCDELVLYKSVLNRHGVTYTPLFVEPFGATL